MEAIIKNIVGDMIANMENECVKVCQSYGFDVDKERLIQALTDARKFYDEGYRDGKAAALAERIPAVDAVALPCKVGDTVWGIRNYKGVNHPQQGKVDQMYYTNDMRLHIKIKHICIGEWGKKIFPTREEAEAALKRRADNGN